MTYEEKIMIPDNGAVYDVFNLNSNECKNFLTFQAASAYIKENKDMNDSFIIRLTNLFVSPYDIVSKEDIDKFKGITIREFKDEICKLAKVREIILSKNEIYGEIFRIRGRLNTIYEFMFDYDVLYGVNKKYNSNYMVLSDFYKNFEIIDDYDKSNIQKIKLDGLEFKIESDVINQPDDTYNGENNIYACVSGEVCYLQDNSTLIPTKLGSKLTYFGPNSKLFLPKSTIKNLILTNTGSVFVVK